MRINIVLIGLGHIGKRHLQALDRLNTIDHLFCFDTNKMAWKDVELFCSQNNLRFKNLQRLDSLESAARHIDHRTIVIVATTAKARIDILLKVIRPKPLAILAEKPLCQYAADYRRLTSAAKKYKVPKFINFPRHVYSVYQHITQELKQAENASFTVVFSGGMSCNGIHFFELATWLLGAQTFKILYSSVDKDFAAKRKGFRDFSGEIIVRINEKHLCIFKCHKKESAFALSVQEGNKEFRVYETEKKMIVHRHPRILSQKKIELPLISQLTDRIVTLIAQKKPSGLPGLDAAYLSHRILFDYMQRHRLSHLNIT